MNKNILLISTVLLSFGVGATIDGQQAPYSKVGSGVNSFNLTMTDSQVNEAKRNQAEISEAEDAVLSDYKRLTSSKDQIASNKRDIDNLKWRVTTAEQNVVKHVRLIVSRTYVKHEQIYRGCGHRCEDKYIDKYSTEWRTDSYQWSVPSSKTVSLPSDAVRESCRTTGGGRDDHGSDRNRTCSYQMYNASGSAKISSDVVKFYGKNLNGSQVRLDKIQVYKGNRWQTLSSPYTTGNKSYSL
ncbi:hypothetical protein [Vibrio crassostreae]|uniref:hypothetical protein n=1 Tax=Vibrio crassostreae TaxID=246167 RepID=UPI001B305FF3|nr:hypothetical protein [Vibrio crassostreae]